VQPLNSVFLDAIGGGVIDEIFVEEGSFVEAGQPLLQFNNTDLQLNVARNDTTITEQLNNLTNISNTLETTKITTERQIIDTEYRIITLERLKERQQGLIEDSLISRDQYDATLDELDYQNKVLANILARQDLENLIRDDRLIQIETQIIKLEENLAVSQSSYENLLVRAPISGQLTSFPVEVGENKTQGQRLGQIDVVEQYKIVAQIDEFYVTRIAQGQESQFSISGQNYTATVDKIYPEITSGTFEVDLIFQGISPQAIRRGQTIQMNLTLSNSSQSLILPLGGFIQDTGGTWVFVLDSTGEYATKREIRVGRRNNRFIEVQNGLLEGENVITSSYNQMLDMERIAFL
jgi:HlyD family secretion protein